MKFIYIISFISIFHLLYTVELGGVKFAVTEKMAQQALDYFYSDINKEITKMQLEDIHIQKGVNIREIEIGIPNFTKDKVKFTFKESGVNINISGLKAWVSATIYVKNLIIPFHNNIHIDVKEFSLNANLRVFGKKDGNKLIPWAEFTQPPSHTINFNFDNDGFMLCLIRPIESKAKSLMKDAINDFIKNKSNKFLEDALSMIPVEIAVDQSNGLFIDYSLIDNIKMKTGYLEVNSYAFFYNKNKSQTQNKKNFPLSLIPPITSIDNPNQVFISQYSINSALYTYFVSEPLKVSVDVNANILGILFPSLLAKYPGQEAKVVLEVSGVPSLEFEENYISSSIRGTLRVHLEGRISPIFVCAMVVSTKVEIIVIGDKTVSGKVNELNINAGQIYVNEANTEFLIENVNKLIPFVLPAVNDAILKRNVKFTLPDFFLNVKVEHKSKYLAVNYILGKITKF